MSNQCQICNKNSAKYTCPKCSTKYCSLTCFKSEAHKVKDEQTQPEEPQDTQQIPPERPQDKELQKIMDDPEIKSLLREPTLQFHLLTVFEMIADAKLTGESTREARLDIANKKLAGLRKTGAEENELVEEFCERVLNLLKK